MLCMPRLVLNHRLQQSYKTSSTKTRVQVARKIAKTAFANEKGLIERAVCMELCLFQLKIHMDDKY